ncbi:MAG: C39 family peptidase [Chloroflexota bacterium]
MPKLNVPYRSQMAEDAASHNTDCGPTCAAMVLNYYGHDLTPDQAYDVFRRDFRWFFGRDDFTFTRHLISLQEHFGVDSHSFSFGSKHVALAKLKSMIDDGRPFIALVEYAPWQGATGNRYTGGHFVVVTGYDDQHVLMHDPLFSGPSPEAKAHFKLTFDQFAAGWGGFAPNVNPNWHMIFPTSPPINVNVNVDDDSDDGSDAAPSQDDQDTSDNQSNQTNQGSSGQANRPNVPPVVLPNADEDEVQRRIEALAGWHGRSVDWSNGLVVQAWTEHLGGFGREVKIHQVGSGDTLSAVSGQYYNRQDKWKAIMGYNRLTSEFLIIGQRLRIPMPGDDTAHTLMPNHPDILNATESEEFFDLETEAAEYESFAEASHGIGFADAETEGAAAVSDDSEAAGFSSQPDVVTNDIAPGQTFTGIWTFKNTGSTLWDENYKVVHVPKSAESTGGIPTAQMAGESSYTITDIGASSVILPGETLTISIDFVAPDVNKLVASHWQLQNGDGENFGALRWISVNIVGGSGDVPPPPEAPEKPVTKPAVHTIFIPSVSTNKPAPIPTVEFGMNINPNPGGGSEEIDSRDVNIDHQKGLGWVRYAYWASRNGRSGKEAYVKRYRELIKTYADAGIKTLIVLHQDTHWGNGPWDNGGWGIYASQFAQECAGVARACLEFSDMVAYQIFNETDSRWGDDAPNPNKSAIGIAPDKFGFILQAAATSIRKVDPNATIVAGGMKTGPENAVRYLKAVEQSLRKPLPVDALAYHPYGRRATSEFDFVPFGTLTDALGPFKREFPTLPVWLTEIGVPGHEHVFPESRYSEIATFMNEAIGEFKDIHAAQVPVIIWFAWSDFSENSGIVTKDGRFKSEIVDAYNTMRNFN